MLGYLAVGVRHRAERDRRSAQRLRPASRHLAEFGIVFLMFVIGLEFNLPKLQQHAASWCSASACSQVVLTIRGASPATRCWLAASPLPAAAGASAGRARIALGGALAMSSTAIVVKLMAERLELESEHGRRVMGVLLFQDLAVVPLLVLIPALGSTPEVLLRELGVALRSRRRALLALLLVGGRASCAGG